MPTAETIDAPDLSKTLPRSPFELLAGYILLPRIIDKCRADAAGTLGEYSSGCGLDLQFFNHFNLGYESFKEYVATGASDNDVVDWLTTQIAPAARTNEALAAWAYDMRCYAPESPEKKAYFEQYRQKVAPTRFDITTWLMLLHTEENG